jgi:hypothetical protein
MEDNESFHPKIDCEAVFTRFFHYGDRDEQQIEGINTQ